MISPSEFEKIKASGHLPSPKGVAVRVIELTAQDDVTNQEVARAIKSDPVLSSRIIKLANALVAYQTRPIASIVDAVSVLGFNTVRQLVLGLSLIDGNRAGTCHEFDYQGFWARSLLTAVAAQNLVLHSGIGSTEEMFILGLLGQVGSLALATAHPQKYGRIVAAATDNWNAGLAALERAEFGFDHNQLTQAMLEDWGMPPLFQEVALHHEEPGLSGFTDGSRGWHLLNILHVADYFSRVCLAHEAQRRKMVPQLILGASRLGVEMVALAKLGDKSVREWRDWGKLCDIRTAEVPPYAELLEAVPLVPSMFDSMNEPPSGIGTFYKLRILLVEDDRASLLLLKALLEKAGHTVVTAGNGVEGLRMVEKHMPQLIITDWMMPEMDGIEFCKALRQNPAWRQIYVFIMTALEGTDKLVEAFEAGANDYMTKPVSPKVLVARLRAGQRVVQLQEEMEFDRQQLNSFSGELAAANHRLRKSDVSMRAILDNSPYMAWLKDTEGRYININKTYLNYVRRNDIQQVIGKTDFDLWPQALAERYHAADVEVMGSRQQKHLEEPSLDGDKMHWVETVKTPVIDEHGNVLGTTGFARDISERIMREEQRLAEVKEQRDVLVREVHHRIKNNLQGVVGLLRQHVLEHPEIGDIIKTIIGRVYSIATIHGLQAQTLSEDVNLDSLMKSIIDASACRPDYQNMLARSVFLNREETVPIALVLNELLTNACKHRSANSAPLIKLETRGTDTIITIVNRFDAGQQGSAGARQGLKLVNSLLPHQSAKLSVVQAEGNYAVKLVLAPPVTTAGLNNTR